MPETEASRRRFSWKVTKSIVLYLLVAFLLITAGVFWYSFLKERYRSTPSQEAAFPALTDEQKTAIQSHLRQWRDEEVEKERKKWETERGRKLTKDQFAEQIVPK